MKLPSIYFLLAIFQLLFIYSNAQNYPRKGYDWKEINQAVTFQPSVKELQLPAIIVSDKRYFDYAESTDSTKAFDLYVTKHKVIYVIDDKGIDRFNKVYIPLEKTDTLLQLKARTINSSGKIVEVNRNNIKDISNYKQYGNIKIFALEGVEKKSEIEYFYTVKKDADIYGEEYLQNDALIKEMIFELTSPSFLSFDAKGYNGLPNLNDDTKNGIRTLSLFASNIPAMVEEQYATAEANRMKVAYKLAYNHHISENKFITWNTVATKYYNLINNVEIENKIVAKFIKQLKINKKNKDEQIIAIEDYFKQNITYKKELGLELSDPTSVLETKTGNEIGITRLYAATFNQLEIPFYLVVTSNRYDSKFDTEFIDYNNLETFLLYFPETQKYISPLSYEYRYGPAPIYNADNQALYIKGQKSYTLKPIALLGIDDNRCLLDAEIVFDSDMDVVTVKKKLQWTGYRAIQLRGMYEYADLEGKNEIIKTYTTSGIEDAKPLMKEEKGLTINDNLTDKPACIKINYKASSLIENAGKNYLLNVGKIIGNQSEMYQENERVNDIEMESPIQYKHHIYFKIPKGYIIKGLEDIKMDRSLQIDGKRICQFVSDYNVKDDMIEINAHEFYKTNHFPKAQYEDFRKVINTASDFNKLVLVLEKE